MSNFAFEVNNVDGLARAGTIKTKKGVIETPVFMPVATVAAFRGLSTHWVEELDYPIILSNTLHLLLRPGPELVQKLGGIQKFMNWDKAVLTDSGGFQVYSLSKRLKIKEKGAEFKGFVDGKNYLITPERSIETQKALGSDVMMAFDHCVPSTAPEVEVADALARTTRWAKRSYDARGESQQALFGIVQGACSENLRKESAEQLTQIAFDGFALGGLAVGESREDRERIVATTSPLLPINKPKYLMGVGTPLDLLEAVKSGIDMFDCILPVSVAQTGAVYTSKGRVDLNRGVYKELDIPLDPACACYVCRKYSRAYLRHLLKCDELVVREWLGVHNLSFYKNLMKAMRAAIISRQFQSFYSRWAPLLSSQDLEYPPKE